MIVIDASAVLDLILRPSTIDTKPPTQTTWHAPNLLETEFVSGVRGLLIGGQISPSDARRALVDFTDLGLRFWPLGPDLRSRLLGLAARITAYDAAYVALAEALDAPLVTRDRRLARAARDLVAVHLI